MFKAFFNNTGKPQNTVGGNLMLSMMNRGHDAMARWGMSHLPLKATDDAIDLGCGGGRNISHLLQHTTGRVWGIDHSPTSIARSERLNKRAILTRRTRLFCTGVDVLPIENESFDVATAFETVYFWPDLAETFREVYRILRPGGRFLICNEDGETTAIDRWATIIDNMTVYNRTELCRYLDAAGFTNLKNGIHKNGHWIYVLAEKTDA